MRVNVGKFSTVLLLLIEEVFMIDLRLSWLFMRSKCFWYWFRTELSKGWDGPKS